MKKRRHKRTNSTVMTDIVKSQNTAGNTEGTASNNQGSPDDRHAGALGPQTNPIPNTVGREPYCKSKEEHWSVKLFAFIAAIGGFAAALFTGFQWWVAWDSEEISNRAFVVANSIKLVSYNQPGDKERPWQMAPVIENTGNTPTRRLRFVTTIGICGGAALDSKDTLDKIIDWRGVAKKGAKNQFTNVIGPKSEIIGTSVELANVTINCPWTVDFVGVAKFDDIFDRPHITEFCSVFHFPTIDFQNYPMGVPIRIQGFGCSYHNCSDDECGADWKQRAAE
jgi:hypothetical protein